MKVTAWNNGSHNISGSGYGLKIRIADRDRYFQTEWQSVMLLLPENSNPVEIEISNSFWHNCPELRGREIGQWLRAKGLAPWPRGNPPEFELIFAGSMLFRLGNLIHNI